MMRRRCSPQLWIVEDEMHAVALLGCTVDLATAANITIDQIAYGEAHIGLVGWHPRLVQAIAHPRGVGGQCHLQSRDCCPRKRPTFARHGLDRSSCNSDRPLEMVLTNVEVGSLARVSNEKGASIFGPTKEVDHSTPIDNAIARLEYETTQRHAAILRLPQRAA